MLALFKRRSTLYIVQ